MTYRLLVTVPFALAIGTSSAAAQATPPSFDIAALQLAVSELRAADSLVTRQGVLHPLPGRRFVVATLRGEAMNDGRLITTPTLFAAQIEQRLVPARAFGFVTARETQTNWVVRPDGDPSDAPMFTAILRRGPVQVQVLFEVPANVTTLQVALPARASGITTIGTP
ncbi:MAG TPA: hypothetical protein VK864_02705 [Longimicrobiales bacterium]|nr:hypothetical protein [Longimicrobiales bacterium]